MPDDKPLKPAELRKAFGAIKERLDKLEEKVRDQNAEAQIRADYIRGVQAKIDRYSMEVADLVPRIIAAEAQLGRANANHDKLWGLLGETAHGITSLREMVRETLGEAGDEGKGGDGD